VTAKLKNLPVNLKVDGAVAMEWRELKRLRLAQHCKSKAAAQISVFLQPFLFETVCIYTAHKKPCLLWHDIKAYGTSVMMGISRRKNKLVLFLLDTICYIDQDMVYCP
jgi:hypothetical protein